MTFSIHTPTFLLADLSKIDFISAFKGSPVIYSVLFLLSMIATTLWIYSLMTLKLSSFIPAQFIGQIRQQLEQKQFDKALLICQQQDNFSAQVLACGIASRRHGPQVMLEAMQAEGKRCGHALWQRISLLNDIAVTAPMLGLLGTVLGMFYAFYDINRTQESIVSIFDGLGVAIGTTVCGLVVSILAMLYHTTLKYRVAKILNSVENEALNLGTLIEPTPFVQS